VSLLTIYCPTSNFRAKAGRRPLRCPLSNAPLEYTDLPPFSLEAIDPTQMGHWRYAAMLPVVMEGHKRITLGEGWTPLIQGSWSGQKIYWKYDALMPTGSYRDRGTSVMVNWLVGHGAITLMNDSSGNAGASLACYAGRARRTAWIYIPESTPEPKKVQISSYGAELVEVPGPRHQSARAVREATLYNKESSYASHAWHPAFLLGQMTCAWEIWEQLGQQVPDWLIMPAGHGSTLLGAWRGFQHLKNSGVTDKLPRLVAVQAEPYTPIYEAFHQGLGIPIITPHMASISADGVAISHPVRGVELLKALHQSGGTAIAIEETAVVEAHHRMAEWGLFVEPTSALVAAAMDQLKSMIAPEETVVAVLTAHGLKRPL